MGASGGISVDRTVWNIIRSHLSKDVANDENVENEARTGEEGDGVQQIIYVTYHDPDDPSEARTLHIVDDMQADGDTVVSGLFRKCTHHFLHLHKVNTYREGHVCPSLHMLYFQNFYTNFSEVCIKLLL